MKKLFTLLFALITTVSLQAQTTMEWMVLSVIGGTGLDIVRSIAIGSDFAVFAATSDGGLKTGDDIVYGVCNPKTGAVSRTRYAGPGSDRAVAVFLDEAGNGIAVGNSQGSNGVDVVIIKFDKAANEIWVNRFDGPAHGDDIVREASMDPRGNIVITGVSHGTDGDEFFVARYSPSGERQWATWPNAIGEGSSDALAMSVDDKGNIFVAGRYKPSSGPTAGFTAMIERDGALGWATFPIDIGLLPTDMAVDNSGNVIVVGFAGSNNAPAATSLNSRGQAQWTQTLDITGGGMARSLRCVTDKLGNIFLAGYVLPSACISTPCPMEIFSGMMDKRGNVKWTNSEERLTTSVLLSNEVINGFMDYVDDWCVFGGTAVHNDGEIYGFIKGVNQTGTTVFSTTNDGVTVNCFDAVTSKGKTKSSDIFVGGASLSDDSKGDGYVAAIHDQGPFPSKKISAGNIDHHHPITLEVNSPNPVATETVIGFTLPQEMHVRLSIYDALGREVAVLADQTIGGGHHKRSFDASHLAAGIYKVRMVAAGQESVRTMVVSAR